MPSRLSQTFTEHGRLADERRALRDLWIARDDELRIKIVRVAKNLIAADEGSIRPERIRSSWKELWDSAVRGDAALRVYLNGIAVAVCGSGLHPAADLSPRDFSFNSYFHAAAWYLASGLSGWYGPDDDEAPFSPSVNFNVHVSLTAWNPQAAVDQARSVILHKLEELRRTDPDWAAYTPEHRRPPFHRQSRCLYLRLNRKMTIPQIASELVSAKRGGSKAKEPDDRKRIVSRDIQALAARLGLRHTNIRQPCQIHGP